MWCTIHQAFLAERMLEMNQAEANEGQGLPGLAGELRGGQSGEPHAQDKAAEILRARLRGLFGGAKKEQQEAGHLNTYAKSIFFTMYLNGLDLNYSDVPRGARTVAVVAGGAVFGFAVGGRMVP
jgi:hypothetical protein